MSATLTPDALREAVARAIDDEPGLASNIERDITAAPSYLADAALRAIVQAAGLDARAASSAAGTLDVGAGASCREQIGAWDTAGGYRQVAALLRALASATTPTQEGGHHG